MKKKIILWITISALISSCLIHSYNINDACEILDKRSWKNAVYSASEKWQVPPELFLAFIYQESKFVEDARPPRKRFLWIIPTVRPSSAYGYSQALDGTWDEYKKESGKFFASRDDFASAVDFIGWYVSKTNERTGLSLNDVYGQYLAYHEGAGGFNRGTYLNKPWLISVAKKVDGYSTAYRQQLMTCN